jgi:hypothetical protein
MSFAVMINMEGVDAPELNRNLARLVIRHHTSIARAH